MKNQVGNSYKEKLFAERYDDLMTLLGRNNLNNDLVGFFARKVNGNILEIGCGTGRQTLLLAEKHAVTGVDSSTAMLEQLKYKYEK